MTPTSATANGTASGKRPNVRALATRLLPSDMPWTTTKAGATKSRMETTAPAAIPARRLASIPSTGTAARADGVGHSGECRGEEHQPETTHQDASRPGASHRDPPSSGQPHDHRTLEQRAQRHEEREVEKLRQSGQLQQDIGVVEGPFEIGNEVEDGREEPGRKQVEPRQADEGRRLHRGEEHEQPPHFRSVQPSQNGTQTARERTQRIPVQPHALPRLQGLCHRPSA